jgi:P4 family phage/plasmid primase-like protien
MTSVVQPLIQPDLAAIAAHLQALFSPVLADGRDGLIEIRHGPIDPALKRAAINHNAWFRLDQIDAAAAYAADCNARGHNVYVGVNPRKPDTDQSGHGADVDVALAYWHFADLDDPAAVAAARAHVPLRYSMLVMTGAVPEARPHFYWRLEEPCANLPAWTTRQRAIAAHLGGDAVINPSRIMRLAGTVNYPAPHKIERGYRTELTTLRTFFDDDTRGPYSFEMMAMAFPDAVARTEPPPADPPAGAPAIDTGQIRVADLISAIRRGDQWHNHMVRLVAHMVSSGRTDAEIIGLAAGLTLDGHTVEDTVREMAKAMRGARAKWAIPEPGAGDDAGGEAGDDATPVQLTEDALAEGFTLKHAQDWRYVAAWGQWLTWTGTVWVREDTLKAYDLSRKVCRAAARKAPSVQLKTRLSSASTIAAVERIARADRRHAETTEVWDRDPWALNTPAGVVDLHTAIGGSHDRPSYMTKITSASPQGDCQVWREFLATVTGGDTELQLYLQRMAGYCLTGVTSEHALFFLYGTGANGKSVFANTLTAMMGDYATVAAMDMFMASHGDRHPTDMASLRGARVVTAIETEQGSRWAESKLKALTGGDKITARFMRQDFFEFIPQFKLLVVGNHKPSIRNVDEAMRRRLHMIPFTVTIPAARRDKRLPDRLLAERDGILRWAIEGCLEWQRIGLQPPASVLAATEEYFDAEDAVGRWLDERCDQAGNLHDTSQRLYASWKTWADENGEFAGSNKRFSETLTTRGFLRANTMNARGFRGLAVRLAPISTDLMEH